MPIQFDRSARLDQLRGFLNPDDPRYEREGQHTNIRALIELYEEKVLDGTQTVYICEGKIITREEFERATTWCLIEVSQKPFVLRQY